MNIPDIARHVGHSLKSNSPAILTGMGLTGLVTTAYFAHRAGQRAQTEILNFESKEKGLWVKSTAKEQVQLTWRLYIPTVLMGVTTASCIIGAHTVGARRNAALLSGLSLSQQAFTEYRDKVVETIGEPKEQKIKDEVVKERVLNSGDQGNDIHLGPGKVLCHDELTGRFFSSDMETIRGAMNDINAKCNGFGYATLNEFWSKIGLPTTSLGDMMGFNPDTPLELNFSSFVNEKGIPVLSYRFHYTPTTDYASSWR